MTRFRWERCVYHRGTEAQSFVRDFFGDPTRKVLLICGGGFDPRSTHVGACLVEVTGADRVRGLFIREDRPDPNTGLVQRAEANVARLAQLIPDHRVERVSIFAGDGAAVGGRRVATVVSRFPLDGITDILVDFSALSVGIAFPIVRYFLLRADQKDLKPNLHVVVTDETNTDLGVVASPSEKAEPIAGFKGPVALSDPVAGARLWLPQMIERKHAVLARIHTFLQPHDVCPILPWPARDPRRSDRLIAEYAAEFESVWEVDAHDIVYADDRNPLDLYRTVLSMDHLRERVFEQVGGSQTILSPIGSKVLSIGALMAAHERDFPVVYVEAVSYSVDFGRLDAARETGELVHVWLCGESGR